MTTAPLVSVVIPTYNRPELLAEAIDSALAQTLREMELVVVDDGSTDDTPARLAQYGERIRVVRQANGGIGVARNRGIDESRGRYVALLDHDDWWLPEKLERQVEYMASHPEAVACAVPYATSAAPDAPVVDKAEVTDAAGHVTRPLLRLARGQVFMGTSSLMFDRARAAGARYGTARDAIEDVQFQVGLVARGPIGIAGERALAVWRVHAENFSARDSYYYNGIRELRRLARAGAFDGLSGTDRADLRELLGHVGRISALRQLNAARRARGWSVYLGEFGHQARLGRLRFLAAFPVLGVLPPRVVRRCLGAH